MEGSGLGAAIALAFLCGLGAWVLFTILPNVYRPARWPVVIVAALMGGLNGLQRVADVAPPTTEQIERQLVESAEMGDLARAFRQADPLAFNAYIERIRAAKEAGESDMQAMLRASMTLQAAAEARLAFRPVEDIPAYYQLRRDELLAFRDTNPAICRQVVLAAETDGVVPLTAEMARRRSELYLRAFGPIGAAPPAAMSRDELRAALEQIFAEVSAVAGSDVDLLDAQADATGREARSCEVIAEYMNQLAISPDAQRIFVTLRQAQPLPT